MTKRKDPKDFKEKGRPPKWKPIYNQAIIDFFTVEVPFREHTDSKGKVQILPTILPLFQNFAESIGVDMDTVCNWAKVENKNKYPGFFGSYARAKHLQEAQLIQGAMANAYAPQFSIFLAKNVTGMKDTQVLEGNLDKPLEIKTKFASSKESKKYLEDFLLAKKDKFNKNKK